MASATHDIALQPLRAPSRPAALVRMALDSVVAVGVLVACVLGHGLRFDGAYLILALLAFSLTFPGTLGGDTADAGALARRIFLGWAAIVAMLLLVGWSSGTLGRFDTATLLAWVGTTPIALYGAHRLAPRVLAHALAAEGMRRRAVIVGANALGRELAARIEGDPLLGLAVAGFFEDRGRERGEPAPPGRTLGCLADIPAYVKRHAIDVIYIALPMAAQPRILLLLEELHDTTASIYFVPDVLLYDLIQARVDAIGGLPVVAVCESPYRGFDAVVKRASDLVLASAILVLIAPLMAALAAGVKLSSPGPVFFAQRRYGMDGREIVVYKFRTMTCLEDGAVVRQATENDARITPFGAFLRRFSLDELPQFINVLQGRMSVVGPRPHAVAHNELYRGLIRGYMIRHKVRPGITGLAQVSGLRGETDSVDKMKARIECDLAYLRRWSLLLDLRIVLRTVGAVLDGHNAR